MWVVDVIAAFFMGALSGMGIGGGGLLVIYLTLIRNMDQIGAQGINLYFFLFASVAALFVHCKRRNINYKMILFLAAFGMPAALVGGYSASVADPDAVRKIFGGMLILAGGTSLMRAGKKCLKNKKRIKK